MEVFGNSTVAGHTNVIFLSSILGQDGPHPIHKCDWKCQNEHVCGNMYLCKLTGLTHICDKNCNQRILYDNHSSLCRVSKQIFPLTPDEQQAVRGVRRKLDSENWPKEICAFKHRRDAQYQPSLFERSFTVAGPICSPVGDDVYNELSGQVRDAVISLIDQEREGEQVDGALLKNILDIFVEIGMGQMHHYESDFEEAMLTDTAAYYSRKASNWIVDDSCPDYMLKGVAISIVAELKREEASKLKEKANVGQKYG
ncbi:hypothetical protein OROGR_017983 [Orobanche gracilis]